MSRESVAWHEAGHLAAAELLMPGSLQGASIIERHWNLGRAEYAGTLTRTELDDAWYAASLALWVDPAVRDRVERDCVVSLAGGLTQVIAEERGLYLPEPPPNPTDAELAERSRYIAASNSGEPEPPSDDAFVDRLLGKIATHPDEARALRVVLQARTVSLIRRNSRFWPLAEAFAAALLHRDELDAQAVAAVIEEVAA